MVSVSQNIESRLENPKLQNKSFDNYCESELQESIVKETDEQREQARQRMKKINQQ